MVAGIDLCLGGDHGCSQICVSTPGSYYCNCERGFQLINTTECEGIIVLLSLQAVCSSNHMYYTQMWMNAPLYLMDTVVSNASIHTDPTTVTVWRDSVFLECFSVKVMKTYILPYKWKLSWVKTCADFTVLPEIFQLVRVVSPSPHF